MTNKSNETITFNSPILKDIVLSIVLPSIISVFIGFFSKNSTISLVTFTIILLITLLYIILSRNTISIDSLGIKIFNKISESIILWSEIKSISLNAMVNDTLRYEILTKNGMKVIPYIQNHEQFEELFEKYAGLELYADSFPMLSKRWKKIGQPYEYTSNYDHLNDLMFK